MDLLFSVEKFVPNAYSLEMVPCRKKVMVPVISVWFLA
ncbi:unnamed protein product [Brugia timori]|uniref:Neur_chan_LBD domain-containing protein n=1 Tax=Brugia timori TaxID=42155 RepID=A0A0R3QKJ0_9BILA|nr:unnamed protein product [Brugia timori]